nr:MAG TPA: hypothetical protein [Caudoviricetes sp.]
MCYTGKVERQMIKILLVRYVSRKAPSGAFLVLKIDR